MSAETDQLIIGLSGPIPQFHNPEANNGVGSFQPLQGRNGASFVEDRDANTKLQGILTALQGGVGGGSASSHLLAAGAATATTSDASITTTGFNHIAIIHDGPDPLSDGVYTLYLSVDEGSTLSNSKRIILKTVVKDGEITTCESFEDDIVGTVLHYSASAETTFRFEIR